MKRSMAGSALTLALLWGAASGLGGAGRPQPVAPARAGNLEGEEHLDRFFEGLRGLEAGTKSPGVLRVLHFGDGHTASDHWTGWVRQHLQARFGDAGPGLLLPARPWRGYPHEGVREQFNPKLPAFSLRSRQGDGFYGLAGGAVTLPSGEAYRVQAPFRGFSVTTLGPGGDRPGLRLVRPLPSDLATRPAVFDLPLDPDLPPLALASTALPQPGGLVLQTFTQPALGIDGTVELSVTLPESSRLLGVELRTGLDGVTYEELGLEGAELFDLDQWNPDLRKALLAQASPALLVLAYGTSDLLREDLDREDYRTRAAALFTTLAQESGAPILVVGPTDRGARDRRARAALRAREALLVEALRSAARDANCAFWDARAAMGGGGTMVKWAGMGWARKDLAQLTPRGARVMAEMEFQALMGAYARFRGRIPVPRRSPAAAPGTQ